MKNIEQKIALHNNGHQTGNEFFEELVEDGFIEGYDNEKETCVIDGSEYNIVNVPSHNIIGHDSEFSLYQFRKKPKEEG